MMLALDALQRRFKPSTSSGARRSFDDGESVVADPVGMGLNLRVRQHLALPEIIDAVLASSARSDSARAFGVGEMISLRRHCGSDLRGNGDGRYRVFQNATTRWAVEGIRRA